jgi:hypothetical protein
MRLPARGEMVPTELDVDNRRARTARYVGWDECDRGTALTYG